KFQGHLAPSLQFPMVITLRNIARADYGVVGGLLEQAGLKVGRRRLANWSAELDAFRLKLLALLTTPTFILVSRRSTFASVYRFLPTTLAATVLDQAQQGPRSTS